MKHAYIIPVNLWKILTTSQLGFVKAIIAATGFFKKTISNILAGKTFMSITIIHNNCARRVSRCGYLI
jgi:hypothetical protein